MRIWHNPHQHLHDPSAATINGQPFESEDTPARMDATLAALASAGFPAPLPPADHGLMPILAVHDPAYVHFLQTAYLAQAATGLERAVLPDTFAPASARRQSRALPAQPGSYAFGTGTPILAGTWQAAYGSAQCALSAAQAVLQGERCAYAACRPPGHHAGPALYGGFCFLNNAAIARRALPGRAAILDIDYHHGNGTQEIFYEDGETLYVSLHADPDEDYPYFWGGADERGAGPGAGANLNLPLPLGTGDEAYIAALETALQAIQDYEPHWLIVSAGFDIAPGDPAGGFNISGEGCAAIARRIHALGLPTLILQEGGYQLDKVGEYAVRFFGAFD